MKKLIQAIIITLAVAAFVSSCIPTGIMQTKAIILDNHDNINYPTTEVVENEYMYRIYLPSYGITYFYADWQLYEKGDTVLIYDQWRNYNIK